MSARPQSDSKGGGDFVFPAALEAAQAARRAIAEASAWNAGRDVTKMLDAVELLLTRAQAGAKNPMRCALGAVIEKLQVSMTTNEKLGPMSPVVTLLLSEVAKQLDDVLRDTLPAQPETTY